MSDLIDRQAAIDALKRNRELFCDNTPKSFSRLPYGDKCRVDEIDSAIAVLVNMPSAQPERKTGEWIEAEVMPKTFDVNGIETWASKMQCDQCGFITYAIEGHMGQYNFCPNCGADMRGGNK